MKYQNNVKEIEKEKKGHKIKNAIFKKHFAVFVPSHEYYTMLMLERTRILHWQPKTVPKVNRIGPKYTV